MKSIQLTLVFCFFLTSYSWAQAQSYICDNKNFLKDSFLLIKSEDSQWSLQKQTSDQPCLLLKTEDSFDLIPKSQAYECQLNNLSDPDYNRNLITLTILDNVSKNKNGFIKLSLDNTKAEYGTKVIKSFIYCKTSN